MLHCHVFPWQSDCMVYRILWLVSKHLFTLSEVKSSWIYLQLGVEHFIYNNGASPCFFHVFSPKAVNVVHTSDIKVHKKTSLRTLTSKIRFPDICTFLLAGVTSILWTLEEDAERFWGFNICSLTLFGRIVELILLFIRLSFTDSLFTFDKLIPVLTIFTTSFLTP